MAVAPALKYGFSEAFANECEAVIKKHNDDIMRIAKAPTLTIGEKTSLIADLITRDPEFERLAKSPVGADREVVMLALAIFMTGCYIYGIATMP
jgi:hypothetical protein